MLFSSIDNLMNKDDFMERKKNDVFEGAERLYYYNDLLKTLKSSYKYKFISKHIPELLTKSYRGGYFASNDVMSYINDTENVESISTMLSHTMQTLVLCNDYGFLQDINKNEILKWINSIKYKSNKIVDLYYIDKCLEILNVPLAFLNIDIHGNYSIHNLGDVLDIESFLILAQKYNISYDKLIINKYLSQIRKTTKFVDIGNLQMLYRYLHIYELAEYNPKELLDHEITTLLNINSYTDGICPAISKYNTDPKQVLIYTEIMLKLNKDFDLPKFLRPIKTDYKEMDPFDLYATSKINYFYNYNIQDMEKYLLNRLRNLNLNTLSQFNYIYSALVALNYKIKKSDVPKKIAEYYKIIVGNNERELKYQDINLINTISKHDIFKYPENNLIERVMSIKTENKEIEALLLYNKLKFLLNKNIKIEKINMLEQLNKFRCLGGYKMTEDKVFFDLYVTYLFIQLISEYNIS
ncbi:MAG: hypothetical protein FWC41_03330 [Firmicutes bacterium]|nr:hypothetical protein [Bacillota bacterium]